MTTSISVTFQQASDLIKSLDVDFTGIYRSRDSGNSSAPHIPRRIMHFWDTPSPPEDVKSLMTTWKEHHPGYEFFLFNDSSASAFIRSHYDEPYVEAYKACTHPAMKADFFRLAFLYKYGGIYIDADERCIEPIENLRRMNVSLILRRMEGNGLTHFNNSPIFCVARLPLLLDCLNWATEMLLAKGSKKLKVWVTTGPGNLSRMFAQRVVIDGSRAYGPLRVLVLDNWFRFAEVMLCRYKLTSRYWRLHDDEGWVRKRLQAKLFRIRLGLVLKTHLRVPRSIWPR